jgi:lipopolysaccharide transport system ATP-binding protein
MYVRLAFAVAAHLEPDILIIDEVLAVGDAEFQRKCLGKMKDVSERDGRTVLFVSHKMAAVKSLCSRAILLENGNLSYDSDVDRVVSSYLKAGSQITNHKFFSNQLTNRDVEIHEIKINATGKQPAEPIIEGEEIELLTRLTIHNFTASNYHITYQLYNEIGEIIFSFSHIRDGVKLENGLNELICKFPEKFFNTGSFYINIILMKNEKDVIFYEKDIISFTIVDSQKQLGAWLGKTVGSLKPSFVWINNKTDLAL